MKKKKKERKEERKEERKKIENLQKQFTQFFARSISCAC